jgi:hypothetical protein
MPTPFFSSFLLATCDRHVILSALVRSNHSVVRLNRFYFCDLMNLTVLAPNFILMLILIGSACTVCTVRGRLFRTEGVYFLPCMFRPARSLGRLHSLALHMDGV